ncbi:MAG: hypothetical protein IT557_12005 [Alphaproteobacteria bacterium]|nr:hypothetical protein [Alphaproteobacteria bacterium]
MALTGCGMLVVFTDIAAADESEFNRWYDREHVAERVGLDGFHSARRFAAAQARRKYLALYETEGLGVFGSPNYQKALANQTAWSRDVMGRMQNFHRLVGAVTLSDGIGRCGAVAAVLMKPPGAKRARLRETLKAETLPGLVARDGLLAAHLVEADPNLSGPAVPAAGRPPAPAGSGEWLFLAEATSLGPLAEVGPSIEEALGKNGLPTDGYEIGTYTLMWDLPRAELDRSTAQG